MTQFWQPQLDFPGVAQIFRIRRAEFDLAGQRSANRLVVVHTQLPVPLDIRRYANLFAFSSNYSVSQATGHAAADLVPGSILGLA